MCDGEGMKGQGSLPPQDGGFTVTTLHFPHGTQGCEGVAMPSMFKGKGAKGSNQHPACACIIGLGGESQELYRRRAPQGTSLYP